MKNNTIETNVYANALLNAYNWDLEEISKLPFIQDDNWMVTGVHEDMVYLTNKVTQDRWTIFPEYNTEGSFSQGTWYRCENCGEWFTIDEQNHCPFCNTEVPEA